MPKPTLALKATVTQRQAAVPSDMAEQLAQLRYHEAQAAVEVIDAAIAAEPAPPKPSRKDLKRQAYKETHEVQSAFLAGNLGKPVSVFLINGIKLTGKIRQYDQFTILLQAPGGMDQMLFKHAVASI